MRRGLAIIVPSGWRAANIDISDFPSWRSTGVSKQFELFESPVAEGPHDIAQAQFQH